MSSGLDFLKAALPTIATALGGPLAGVAAGFVADKLGISDKSVENITNIIAGAPPAQLIELKKLDIELKKFFAQMEIDLEKVHAGDRDSARKREIAVKDHTPKILAYLITIGFFSLMWRLVVYGFPEGNREVLIYMLGTLSTAWTAIMAYYYGSTKGSGDKTNAIVNLKTTR